MEIKAIDMTTPLNVEMLKQLKETLIAINENGRDGVWTDTTTGVIAQAEARERSAAAVMMAIAYEVGKASVIVDAYRAGRESASEPNATSEGSPPSPLENKQERNGDSLH